MRSIRSKTILLVIVAIICSVLIAGGIGLYVLRTASHQMSDQEMTLLSENKRAALNEYMHSLSQSVDMVSRYVGETLRSVELVEAGVIGATGEGGFAADRDWNSTAQRHLDLYLSLHIRDVETVFQSVANHTNGVMSYYYRINPELSQQQKGFWFAKEDSENFTQIEPTDIEAFDADDGTRVAWYYQVLRRGRPTWLDPYDNANIGGVRMISYVVPIYKAGTFIGVVGMDIAFDTLVSHVKEIEIYKTGYAFLADRSATVLYHPFEAYGTALLGRTPELDEIARLSEDENSPVVMTEYTLNGVAKKAACVTLANGLQVFITAPLSEINASWQRLVRIILISGVAILAVFIGISMLSMKRIIDPLRKLTAASQRLAEGDYDVKLEYHGNDEVGILTSSFQQLVEHLKIYISDLNIRAYRDALTSVRNKAGFDIFTRKLNDQLRSSALQAQAFAVVMMDCNDLKEINDQFGHSYGDQYLQRSCKLICDIFDHSPVFRIGGDEFTAVLQGEDFKNRDALLQEFDRQAAAINAAAEHPWERVGLAKGMAVYDPATDTSVESVLKRADERMYQDKALFKQEQSRGKATE